MKYKLGLLIAAIVLPLRIFALEGEVNLNCDKESVNVNEQVTCSVSVSVTSGGIVSFTGKVEFTNDLELVSATRDEGWQGDNNTNDFKLYTDEAKNGNVAIGQVVLKGKANGTATVRVSGISLGDESFNEVEKADVSKSITVTGETDDDPEIPGEDIGGTGGGDEELSSNANISSLMVGGHTLNFSSSQTSYNLNLNDNETSLDISVTLEDSNAAYTIIGNSNLKDGDKVIIKVKAQDGTNKEYVINVNGETTQDVAAPKTAVNAPAIQIVFAIIFIFITISMIAIINKKQEETNN